jgi:hypothetical protein
MSTPTCESSCDSIKKNKASIRKTITTSIRSIQKPAAAAAATTTQPLTPYTKPAILKPSTSAIDGERKSSAENLNNLQDFFQSQKKQRITSVTQGKTMTIDFTAPHLDKINKKYLKEPLVLHSKTEQGPKDVSIWFSKRRI